MSRLLITSFQNPGYNFRELELFKQGAFSSGLVTSDAVWDASSKFLGDFLPDPKRQRTGMRKLGSTAEDAFAVLYDLSETKGDVWSRLRALPNDAFATWIGSLFNQQIDCWVIGGHHHLNDKYEVMAFGNSMHPLPSTYWPFAGFGVPRGGSSLEFFGYSRKDEQLDRVNIPQAAAALTGVSLMLIMGCNGVPARSPDGSFHLPELPVAWRKLLRAGNQYPLILGWFGTHFMPRDKYAPPRVKDGADTSSAFWKAMTRLSIDLSPPPAKPLSLPALCRDHAEDVIKAWGVACHNAFKRDISITPPRRRDSFQWHLWREKSATQGIEGCGAIAPNGDIYHANEKYPGSSADPMVVVGKVLL